MGAWGEGPLENDIAADWVGEHVRAHLARLIENTLKAYPSRSVNEDVAEAAAALLVDCTSAASAAKYHSIDLRYQARKQGLWDLAMQVVDTLMASPDWLSSWNSPRAKLAALKELHRELKRAKKTAKG